MEKEIKNFGYHLSIEKNLSKKTVTTYTNCLYCFTSYVTNIEKLEEITIPDIKAEMVKRYLIYLKDVKINQISTISLKISALKSFYTYLVEQKKIKNYENIMLEIKKPKLPKTLPTYLTVDEAENFLLGIKLLSNNVVRDYAIFSLFLLTGARLSELQHLRLDQINYRNHTVTFYGKGSKERTVPLPERAENALKDYINDSNIYKAKNMHGRVPKEETNIVFLNKYGLPFSERGVQDLFIRLAKKTGIYRKGLSVHKLRHTCFTLLYASGMELLKLKSIAGHENLRTTEIYTHIDTTDLYKDMQHHPLNHNNIDTAAIYRIKETLLKK
ncbi:tyrosine-type recombinase/integrase [Lutispora sp.]|uniref:tyrosine-type recombinase/integrase n=1 Tax=Lutispora sp. TaxID=2828727 RepID=UPI002B1F1AD5|nr:tyrosine-type recombinase/integrase [Lutispora sp.]MEA4960418.1 tyrosine-type recombinase/integrase [Lutispora sp.]